MKTLMTLSVMIGFLLELAGPAFAAGPTQSDFDACNRAAQAAAAPSAAPSTGATGPSITTPSGTPDSSAGVQPGGTSGKTGPMITGSARTPGTPGGVAEGTGALGKNDTSGPGTTTVPGMSSEGQSDPAFKAAFLDCMKQRGF